MRVSRASPARNQRLWLALRAKAASAAEIVISAKWAAGEHDALPLRGRRARRDGKPLRSAMTCSLVTAANAEGYTVRLLLEGRFRSQTDVEL